MKYNEHLVNVSIHITTAFAFTTTEKELGADILKDNTYNVDLRPSMPMYQYNDGNRWAWLKDNSYRLSYKATSNTNSTLYVNFTYARR